MSYQVNVSRQVLRDVQSAVFYKQELGTYSDNINEFLNKIDNLLYERLEDSPLIGASLKSRLSVETEARYHVIDDYILFYDVIEDDKKVDVLRLLPAKSNWMNTILKYL